jgi:hypothetical protein
MYSVEIHQRTCTKKSSSAVASKVFLDILAFVFLLEFCFEISVNAELGYLFGIALGFRWVERVRNLDCQDILVNSSLKVAQIHCSICEMIVIITHLKSSELSNTNILLHQRREFGPR